MPADASPLLQRLVHAANPLRSLEQLADETGIAMPMLSSLTTHLKHWGKVRLIHPLTEHSVLSIRPDAPRDEPPDDFERLFGGAAEHPGYEVVLELFEKALPFGTVIRQSELLQLPKRTLVQIATALLRCRALESLHTYVLAVAEPPEPPSDAPDADKARYFLYRRLKPMLHGEHHLEEIMWQERIGREVLSDLLEQYEEYLIAMVTPDEDVA